MLSNHTLLMLAWPQAITGSDCCVRSSSPLVLRCRTFLWRRLAPTQDKLAFCFACSSSLLVLRSQTLLTPARSTVTLVLVPNRKTLPVPEARTVALAMVPLKTVCPVLQGQALKVEVLVLLFWTTKSPA